MKKLDVLTLEMCPAFEELDEESFVNYYRASAQISLLKSLVIGPFEKALKAATGYSDDNRPKKPEVHTCKHGELEFAVKTIPTEKKPGYQDLYSRLKNLLTQVTEDKKALEMEQVRYEQGHGYLVLLDYVLGKLDAWKAEITKQGVRQELTTPEGKHEPKFMVNARNYETLDDQTAKTYVQAKAFVTWTDKNVITPTEDAIKKETGYSKENIPTETTETFLPFGAYIARIISSRVEKTDYTKIVKTVIAELEKVKSEDPEMSKKYHAVGFTAKSAGLKYIRLKALNDRLTTLETKEAKKEPSIQQKIECYPYVAA